MSNGQPLGPNGADVGRREDRVAYPDVLVRVPARPQRLPAANGMNETDPLIFGN